MPPNINQPVCMWCRVSGFTWSEFHDVAGNRAQMNKLPGFMWLDGPKVVSDAHSAVEAGRRPVIVNGWVYKVLTTLLQIIPDNWVGRLAARGTRSNALRPEDARDAPVSRARKSPPKARPKNLQKILRQSFRQIIRQI